MAVSQQTSQKKKKLNTLGYLQSLGKTFMLPVALMSAMGVILGIGSAIDVIINTYPFLDSFLLRLISNFMITIGGFAFGNIAVLFAIAIPLGLAREEKGVAALAGFVAFFVMNLSINFYLKETGLLLSDMSLARKAGQGIILGVHTLDTGVLGAIISGSITAYLHNKFYTLKLPTGLSFFEGVRFIPILSAMVFAIVGLIIPLIFPLFAKLIAGIGYSIKSSGIFAPFLFASGERFLLPFGLHHILVALIRFTDAGGSEVINNQTVYGALNIYFAEVKAGLPISPEYTRFLSQSKMLFMMFGLPGAALAIYSTARTNNKVAVKGLLISGVIACIVGGISEPIEFLFLFIAPLLYLFHAIMAGLGAMTLGIFNVGIGNTDGNIIDFVIFGILKGFSTKWYLVIPLGAIWFAIYFVVFRWAILKFDLKTPGRSETVMSGNLKGYGASNILKALGGEKNILSLDNCLTRLRLEVADMSLIDEKTLKENGAIGVVKLNETSLQVVIGPHVQFVKNEIAKLMKNND
ncbi:MAG: maltose/glucose-specific PTS transporter subunit IIBC [Alphaproteobacteria bacterium]|jgi:PTS system maltose and glucose-specific IIC component|nr:maltose/glucose-specific PTS transporter subunit IIBC [Alphaproteobacteria bacterium]